MLDDYKDSQKIIYQTIINSVKKNKLSHAYLIELTDSNNGLDFALAISKFLLCPNHYSNNDNCRDCNICHQVDNNNYIELKIIEPDGNYIKKNQVKELQENFRTESIVNNYKIYIILEAEKMNEEAANSMLKFLEEPNDGIIAILLTSNMYQVYNTIKSRCQVINFAPINRIEILGDLEDRGINIETSHIIASLTYNIEEARKMTNDNMITKMIELAKDITLSFEARDHNGLLIMFTKGKFLIEETLKSYHIMFFDMLTAAQNDKIKILINQEADLEKLVFCETIASNRPSLKIEQEIAILELLLKFKERLTYNVNKDLLYAQLFTEIKRC